MNLYLHIFFLVVMTLGSTLAMSSSQWVVAWAGLELSTLAFLPIIARDLKPRGVEAAIKYLLVQAAASSLIFYGAWMSSWQTGSWQVGQPMTYLNDLLFTVALSLKLGLAPLHFWMPEVMQGASLISVLIGCTWMKAAPFFLLDQLHLPKTLLVVIGILSVFIGALGALDQTQFRKILAYSSTAHLGWMVAIMPYSRGAALLTFFIYIVLAAAASLNFLYVNATCYSELGSASAKSLMITISLTFTFLSLAGMPPLTGFAPKWYIYLEFVLNGQLTSALMMLPPTLLNIFFYFRVSHSFTVHAPPNGLTSQTYWRAPQEKAENAQAASIIFAITMLPAIPAFMSLFVIF